MPTKKQRARCSMCNSRKIVDHLFYIKVIHSEHSSWKTMVCESCKVKVSITRLWTPHGWSNYPREAYVM